MAGKSTVPRYGNLITATYAALKILGGSGKNEEINEKVVERFRFQMRCWRFPTLVAV